MNDNINQTNQDAVTPDKDSNKLKNQVTNEDNNESNKNSALDALKKENELLKQENLKFSTIKKNIDKKEILSKNQALDHEKVFDYLYENTDNPKKAWDKLIKMGLPIKKNKPEFKNPGIITEPKNKKDDKQLENEYNKKRTESW